MRADDLFAGVEEGSYVGAVQDRPWIVCAAPIEGGELADAVVGVGKAAAAMRTTQLLMTRRPPWVLLIGVCGAYPGSGLEVGGLCLVGEDVLADEGVALADGGFIDLTRMGFGATLFVGDPARTRALAAELAAPVVRGATVSSCSGSDALACSLAARSGAQVETMEGAAVLQVCQHLGVPVVQLRAVSNRTGERARGGWDLRGAVDRLHAGVRALADVYGWAGMR